MASRAAARERSRMAADEAFGDEERDMAFDPEPVSGSGRRTPEEEKALQIDEIKSLMDGLKTASTPSARPDDSEDHPDLSPIPDRPKFGAVPGMNRKPAEHAMDDTEEGRRELRRKEELAGIKNDMADLESAQTSQKHRSTLGRMQAYNLLAGQAMSSGMGGLDREDIRVPEKYDVAKAKKDKIELGDKLKNSQEKWENMQLERELKDLLADKNNKNKKAIADTQEAGKDNRQEDKQEFDDATLRKKQGYDAAKTDKLIKAGLAGKILGIYGQEGTQGGRADAEHANKQATFQIPQWDQQKPNSPTDHTDGAKLAGAEEAFFQVGKKLADGMRQNGRAFPQSTQWKEVAGDYMALNQVLNHLNQNGVMNFKDKDNNDVQIGNGQELIQYVMNNGPDVLEHAMQTMHTSTDAKMNMLGYKRHVGDWKAKTPSDYMGNTSGAGGSARAGMDPNAAGKLMPWIKGQGDFPPLKSPSPQAPQGQSATPPTSGRKFHWDAAQRKMVDQNGQGL